MHKTDLIQEITKDLEIPKKDATIFLDSLQETIIKIVYDGPWFWKCALNRIRNNSK